MDSLSREGLVHRDTLTFREFVTPSGALRAVNLRGRIYCSDDVILTVNKWLEVALEVGIEPVPLDTLPRLDLVIRESVAVATGGSIEDLHAMPGPEA